MGKGILKLVILRLHQVIICKRLHSCLQAVIRIIRCIYISIFLLWFSVASSFGLLLELVVISCSPNLNVVLRIFQLAILAGYSNDELLSIYRYFRSLAVDNPFVTARDNLIIAFEKVKSSV